MGDLAITDERTLVELPRGDEIVRVTTAKANGRPFVGIREFYRDRQTGEWRPGKRGITIRSRELAPVVEALTRALLEGER